MYELRTGTPSEMQSIVEDQAPGSIRKKARDILDGLYWQAKKFEPETADVVRSVSEEIKALIVSDIRVGEPFRRHIPYMSITYVIEIRRIK